MKIQVGDISINYTIDGPADASVVMCSHCLAGTLGVWDLQVEALKSEFRVVCFDTRGHGGTSAPEGDYTMEMLAWDAVGLMDALDIEQAHFMGISMGGMLAQTLALGHPHRIHSLVLCDTTCSIPAEAHPIWDERIRTARNNGMGAMAPDTLNRWLSPEYQAKENEATGRIRDMILNTPIDGFAGCCRAISQFDVAARLDKISLPTLILVGEKDPGTPVDSAKKIQAGIRGSELAVLPGAYHLSNIEAADEFNGHLLAFLGKMT